MAEHKEFDGSDPDEVEREEGIFDELDWEMENAPQCEDGQEEVVNGLYHDND